MSFGSEVKPPVVRESNEGFSRDFVGFYSAILEIIGDNYLRGEISYNSLYYHLLQFEVNGKKPFWKVKDGERLPMEKWRFIQYLTPSQICPKRNPRFKGIQVKKDGTGLYWYPEN
jgi:hypothetical protein